jgi:tetratricopeptide (TPR) repeat protein
MLADIEYSHDWKWAEAENGFRRALKLNSNYAPAHAGYAYLLETLNRMTEAIEANRRAVELDPLSVIANLNLAQAYYYAGQHDLSIPWYQAAADQDTKLSFPHIYLARAFALKKMTDKALAELSQADISDKDANANATRAQVYAMLDRTAEAQKALTALARSPTARYVRPYALASVYAALGEKTQAFAWLEKAYQERSSWLLTLGVDPQFKSLRNEPEYKNLSRRIGLP